MQRDAAKFRVFWWLLFVVFWCGHTFVRCEEEKEGYESEVTSCLHACCLVSHLGSSQCCLLRLALDLVLGHRILPPRPPLVHIVATLLGSCCN